MKASELRDQLDALIAEHGDCEVCTSDSKADAGSGYTTVYGYDIEGVTVHACGGVAQAFELTA